MAHDHATESFDEVFDRALLPDDFSTRNELLTKVSRDVHAEHDRLMSQRRELDGRIADVLCKRAVIDEELRRLDTELSAARR